MSEVNRDLIRRWYDEVWNKGRTEAIDEMLAPDCLAHGLADEAGKTLCGPAAFKAFHQKFCGAFPDINVTVEDVVAEGDKVVARCTVRGTHRGGSLGFAATGKPIEITGVSISRIENGKIVEGWNNFDFMTLFQQVGAI
jgi:steroid delta-isomerase-like uncharacterized protein